MKVLVLGAAGKLGRQLVQSGLRDGHEVTAAVRNADLFRRGWAGGAPEALRIVHADAMNPASLDAALADQDAAVSAAGNIADGEAFSAVFDNVVAAAERVMGTQRRVWMLAGAAVLDIPHAGRIGIGLPFMPAVYRPHLMNWRRIESARIDWALMCPGPMIAGDAAGAARGHTVSVDTLPFAVGTWAGLVPAVALSLMMKHNLPRITVSYEAVADVIMTNLAPGGRFSRKRVGVSTAGGGA